MWDTVTFFGTPDTGPFLSFVTRYVFNAAYGVGKAAMDRMAADCGLELKSRGVTMISLMPGAVKTEEIMAKIDRGEGLGGIKGMKERFLAGNMAGVRLKKGG